jgi:hypothetical protein
MKDQVLEFSFDGPDAQADAQALADFLKNELPDWPARLAQREPSPNLRPAPATPAPLSP